MRQRRLLWFGHIERRKDNSWLKKVQNLAVDGHSGRGRPRKTWEHVIMDSNERLPLHEQSNTMLAWNNNGLKNDDDDDDDEAS